MIQSNKSHDMNKRKVPYQDVYRTFWEFIV